MALKKFRVLKYPMKTIIYFVRHGTYENPDMVIPGRVPGFHLSEEGKQKVELAGKFLAGKPIKHIYTSPLERTYETANIIGKYFPKAKIEHVFELTEADSIHWQLFKHEDLYTNNYYEVFLNDPDSQEVAENLTALANRMEKFTQSLCQKHQGEQIVCISHEFPIIALRLKLENKSLKLLKSYYAAMASITTLEFDENCKLTKVSYDLPFTNHQLDPRPS